MAIFLPRRWTRQPQGPVEIDRGNHFGKSVAYALLYSPTLRRRELVSGVRDNIGGTTGLVARRDGFTQAIAADIAAERYVVPTRILVGTSRTVFVRAHFGTGGSGGTTWRFGGSSDFGFAIGVWGWASDAVRLAMWGTWSGFANSDIIAPVSSTPQMHSFSAARPASSASVLQRWCVDGAYAGEFARAEDPGAFGSSTTVEIIRESGSVEPQIQVALALTATLSDAEQRELHQNPWQAFRPRVRRIHSLPTGGSLIPTLSLPGVNDILSTSARPKVTLTY